MIASLSWNNFLSMFSFYRKKKILLFCGEKKECFIHHLTVMYKDFKNRSQCIIWTRTAMPPTQNNKYCVYWWGRLVFCSYSIVGWMLSFCVSRSWWVHVRTIFPFLRLCNADISPIRHPPRLRLGWVYVWV